MHLFASAKSASQNWPRIVYSLALFRLSAWLLLIIFCVVCFDSSVVELNRLIRESRPHFEGLTVDQTRDFLVVYLIFGVLYVLIDGKCGLFHQLIIKCCNRQSFYLAPGRTCHFRLKFRPQETKACSKHIVTMYTLETFHFISIILLYSLTTNR
jgi:hypothetical protein